MSISKEGYLAPGTDVNLTCESTGNANPVISWYHRDGVLAKKSQIYKIKDIKLTDAGWYYCEAKKDDKFVRSIDIMVNVTCKLLS